MKALLSTEYTPSKLSGARSELFNTMWGSSSVPFAWVLAKLQSRGRASAACTEMCPPPRQQPPGLVLPVGVRGEKSAATPQPGHPLAWPQAGNPATAGELGTPPLAGCTAGSAQHHPFQQHCSYRVKWPSSAQWSLGLQKKGEISMHVSVPLGPTASRSNNSPFLCAVLMPLLFLISSHYVDLMSSAFLGQKLHLSFPLILKTMLCSCGESLKVH